MPAALCRSARGRTIPHGGEGTSTGRERSGPGDGQDDVRLGREVHHAAPFTVTMPWGDAWALTGPSFRP